MKVCRKCLDSHEPGSPGCAANRVGQTVAGKYEIKELIGVGGMGFVYRAEHVALRRPVALKVLRRSLWADDEAVERLFREARGSAVIGHPAIVEVRDVGRAEDGAPYLEMELLRGVSVEEVRERGLMEPERAVEIALGALEGLGAAHEKGLIHRDIKPANLFLAEEGGGERVKLLDFGFVKGDAGVSLTLPGQRIGTPIYMSPEQYRNPKTVDERTDLFSLGASMYDLLTGKAPIQGRSVAEVFGNLMAGRIAQHPREERPELPEWLDAVVARAMAPAPVDRFSSAAEMRDALITHIVDGKSGRAKSVVGKRSQKLANPVVRYSLAALLFALVALGAFLLGRWRG